MRMFKLNLQIFIQDESFWEGKGFGIKSESLYDPIRFTFNREIFGKYSEHCTNFYSYRCLAL